MKNKINEYTVTFSVLLTEDINLDYNIYLTYYSKNLTTNYAAATLREITVQKLRESNREYWFVLVR